MKSIIRRTFLYLYHKYHNRHLVRFTRTTYLSHQCEFEGMNAVGKHSSFYGTMGMGSYIGNNVHISAYIGRFTSIGHHLSQIVESHPYKYPFATTSPCFFSTKAQCGNTFADEQRYEEYRFYDYQRQIAFKVGNDCWIGNEVCIIGGVEIGDGAVVLSRALVSKDVPPYAIVGGVPARVIGYRYDEETIQFLKRIQWWNNTKGWFEKNWHLLSNLDALKSYYENH